MAATIWTIWLFAIMPTGEPMVWREEFGDRGSCLDRRIELYEAGTDYLAGRPVTLLFTECLERQ